MAKSFSEAFGKEKLRLVAEKKNCSVDSGSLPMANRTTHKTLHSKEEILFTMTDGGITS